MCAKVDAPWRWSWHLGRFLWVWQLVASVSALAGAMLAPLLVHWSSRSSTGSQAQHPSEAIKYLGRRVLVSSNSCEERSIESLRSFSYRSLLPAQVKDVENSVFGLTNQKWPYSHEDIRICQEAFVRAFTQIKSDISQSPNYCTVVSASFASMTSTRFWKFTEIHGLQWRFGAIALFARVVNAQDSIHFPESWDSSAVL